MGQAHLLWPELRVEGALCSPVVALQLVELTALQQQLLLQLVGGQRGLQQLALHA